MAPKNALYPGSFDPVTSGHINIIERGAQLFDEVVVAVAVNSAKKPLFTIEERVDLLKASLTHLTNVKVVSFDGLLVDYLKNNDLHFVIRGLRAISDFEYEFQIAHLNKRLDKEMDTVFMMTSEEYFYVSSSIVRELASFGGDIHGLVPRPVEEALIKKFKKIG